MFESIKSQELENNRWWSWRRGVILMILHNLMEKKRLRANCRQVMVEDKGDDVSFNNDKIVGLFSLFCFPLLSKL